MKMHIINIVKTSMRAQPKVFLRVPSWESVGVEDVAPLAEEDGASRSRTSSMAFFLASFAGLPRNGDFMFCGRVVGINGKIIREIIII